MDPVSVSEKGLCGTFDSFCAMQGENVAIVASDTNISSWWSEGDDLPGISYTELQWSVHVLSVQLYNRFGVRCSDRVLICTSNQTAVEIVAILACARLGAVFVPIDTMTWVLGMKVPSRIEQMIKDVDPTAAVLIAANDDDDYVRELARCGVFRCCLLHDDGSLVEDIADHGCIISSIAEAEQRQEILYILYTSGSTGAPKGVQGTYRGLLNRLDWQISSYPWQIGEIACRKTSLTFVDAIAELLCPLLCGVPIWTAPRGALASDGLHGICREAAALGVSRITLLPSQLYIACALELQMKKEKRPENGICGSTTAARPARLSEWKRLRIVTVSGEECPAALPALLAAVLPTATLLNLYGSTEVTGDVSCAVLSDPLRTTSSESASLVEATPALMLLPTRAYEAPTRQCVSIGQPLRNNFLFVVTTTAVINDEGCDGSNKAELKLVPDGIEGELMVVGEHVSAGYYKNPLESSKNFVRNPFHNNISDCKEVDSKVYCAYPTAYLTGDIVRKESLSGSFVWVGRKDRQVKVRGVRVEMEDVERRVSALLGTGARGLAVLTVSSDLNTRDDGMPGQLNIGRTHDTDSSPSSISSTCLVLVVESEILSSLACSNIETNHIETPQESYSVSSTPACHRLLAYMSTRLEPTIHPSVVFTMKSLPVHSVVGKLDRVQLKSLVEGYISTVKMRNIGTRFIDECYDSIAYDITRKVVAIFRTALPCIDDSALDDRVQWREASFFSLGGDSLRAVQVLYRLRGILEDDEKEEVVVAVGEEEAVSVPGAAPVSVSVSPSIPPLSLTDLSLPISRLADRILYLFEQRNSKIPSPLRSSNVPKDLPGRKKARIEDKRQVQEAGPGTGNERSSTMMAAGKGKVRDRLVGEAGSRLRNAAARYVVMKGGGGGIYSEDEEQTVNDKSTPHATPKSKSTSVGERGETTINPTPDPKPSDSALFVMNERWVCNMRRCVDSSPLCVVYGMRCKGDDGRDELCRDSERTVVYMGSHAGDFIAADVDTGEVLWKVELGQHVEGSAVCSKDGAYVYVTSYTGADVDNIATEPTEYPTFGQALPTQSTVDSTLRPCPSPLSTEGSGLRGSVWAIEAFDGRVQWQSRTVGEIKGALAIHHMQGLGDTLFVCAYDGLLHIFCATTGIRLGGIDCAGSIYAPPVVHPTAVSRTEMYVYVATTGGFLHSVVVPRRCLTNDRVGCRSREYDRISDRNGTSSDIGDVDSDEICLLHMRWSYSTNHSPIFSTPLLCTIREERAMHIGSARSCLIFGVADGSIRCIASDGTEPLLLWILQGTAPIFSSPSPYPLDPTEHGVAFTSSIVIGSHNGLVRRVCVITGRLLWGRELGVAVFATPFCVRGGDLGSVGDSVVVATTAGDVIVLRGEDGKVMNEQRLRGEVYSSPVAVYARTRQEGPPGSGMYRRRLRVLVGCRDNCVHCFELAPE